MLEFMSWDFHNDFLSDITFCPVNLISEFNIKEIQGRLFLKVDLPSAFLTRKFNQCFVK